MLDRLIDASLRQRTFLLLVAAVSLGIGLWSAYRLPIDAVPDITSPQVQVNTEVPALAPEETEQAVTVPLELELSGIQGVEEMRSLTKFGLSQVTLVFEEGEGVEVHGVMVVPGRVGGGAGRGRVTGILAREGPPTVRGRQGAR